VSLSDTAGRGCDINRIAKDAPDVYKRETVLLLKHLPTLRHVKEVRSLGYELFADHNMSPDVAATQAGTIDLLAEEVWYLWRLLLDSKVVDLSMAYNPTFVILSFFKPLFFNSLKNALRFLDNVGA
jgi:hypothetical protein